MRRIAIYARYSSDLQNARSCEDQDAICREMIAKHQDFADFPIEPYHDANASGAYMNKRPALQRLIEDVENGKIHTVISEGIDRLSRSQEHIARIYKICTYHNVPIQTQLEGTISEIHVGLNGTMSAIQLGQIAHRTRRGQAGNIRQGKAAGGLPYGYKVRYLNDEGKPEAGLRDINPDEAKIVKRIYDEFCDGKTSSEITKDLNRDGIPSPRGGRWAHTTINGHTGRGNGILQNPIYKGEMQWNRNNFARRPSDGARRVRYNPKEAIVFYHNPDLIIIDKEQWELAQQIRKSRVQYQTSERKSHEKLPFEVYHNTCRAPMIRSGEQYLICSHYKGKRTCNENRKMRIDAIMVAIYQKMATDIDNIWLEWKHEVHVMRKERHQCRKRKFAQGHLKQVSWALPVLDGVGKKCSFPSSKVLPETPTPS